jgi:hypothetical protein
MAAGSSILVIGIRSIGTTLAATVAAVLEARSLKVAQLTVRPHGHPFNRQAVLPPDLEAADHAIIVDEGPGLSGSSMAAVAEALRARGLPRRALSFFPGHAHGPGPHASARVRRWWHDTPSRSVSWEHLSFANRRADDVLRDLAQALLRERLCAPLRDVGAGRWRDELHRHDGTPLALAPFLEQPKLLARGRNSAGVLFKFAGLVLAPASTGPLVDQAQFQATRLAQLAERGFTVAPLANSHGWLALPWLAGRRLRATDMNASLLQRLALYIGAAAGPCLSAAEREAAFARLSRLLQSNTEALVGTQAARAVARASDRLRAAISQRELPSYGDGRLAPHEWIDTGRRTLKLDAAGHHGDHSAIGAQPIWWDSAGASVEWSLGTAAAAKLARALGLRETMPLSYFRAAYAAFRAAIAQQALGNLSPCRDRARQGAIFRAGLRYYRRCLTDELGELDRP